MLNRPILTGRAGVAGRSSAVRAGVAGWSSPVPKGVQPGYNFAAVTLFFYSARQNSIFRPFPPADDSFQVIPEGPAGDLLPVTLPEAVSLFYGPVKTPLRTPRLP